MDDLTRLALSARDGNRLALGSFIRQTQPDVWRVCSHLGPRGSADDLTQDVYVRMMQALPKFRGDSSARTWLLSIARFTAIDALRARGRRRRLIDLVARPDVEAADHKVELVELIDRLEVGQRAAFVLTQLLGLSYEEAAEASDCAVGTIRSRVARARTHLIDALVDTDAAVGVTS